MNPDAGNLAISSQAPATRYPDAHPIQTTTPPPIFLPYPMFHIRARLATLPVLPAAISKSQFRTHTILPNRNHIFSKIYFPNTNPDDVEASREARRMMLITTQPTHIPEINEPEPKYIEGRTRHWATIAPDDVLMEGSLVFVKTTADVELLKYRYGACCKLVFGDIGYAKNDNGTIQNVMTAGSVFVFDEAKAVLLTTLKFNTFPVWLLVGGVFEDVWPCLSADLQRNVREARNGGNHRATAIEVRSTDELLEVVRLGGEGAWEKMVLARFPVWTPVMGTEQWLDVIGNVLLSSTCPASTQWLVEDYRVLSEEGP